MGTVITPSLAVDECQEYVDYLEHVVRESRRLMREGRLPSDDGVAAFLEDAQRVAHQLGREVAQARATGQHTVRGRVELARDGYRRLTTMSDNLRNLLEILEIREALVLNRTEAVARVATALSASEFVE